LQKIKTGVGQFAVFQKIYMNYHGALARGH